MEDQFLEAAENGDLLTVNRLISKGVNVNCEDKYGNIAIHLAAIKGRKEIIKVLLKTGKVDVNCKEWNDRIPIHQAIDWSHFALIEYLVDNKADFNSKDCYGETPLHRAFQRLNYCCLRNMSSICANLEKINDCVSIKELFISQKNNFGEKCVWFTIIAYLFENGNPNFDIKDIEKKTPLDYIPEKERQFFVNLNEEIRKKRIINSEIKIEQSTFIAKIDELNSVKQLILSNELSNIEIKETFKIEMENIKENNDLIILEMNELKSKLQEKDIIENTLIKMSETIVELKKSFSNQSSELNEMKNYFQIYQDESLKQMESMKMEIIALKINLNRSNFEKENLKKEVRANNLLLNKFIQNRKKEISENIENNQNKILQEGESINTEIANLKLINEMLQKDYVQIQNSLSNLISEINDHEKLISTFIQEKDQTNPSLILNEKMINEVKEKDAKREVKLNELNTCFQQQSVEIFKFVEKYNLLLFENSQLKDNYESLKMENTEIKANIDSIKNELKSKFDEEVKRFQLLFHKTIVKFEQLVKNVKDINESKVDCEFIHKPNEDFKEEFKKLNDKIEFIMYDSCENCRKEKAEIKSLCGRRVCKNCYEIHNIDENSRDRCHLCYRIRNKTNF